MDYGLFKRFDKVAEEEPWPRTSQQQGLFLVELRFSPQDETRSVPVSLTIERTAFGEIATLGISDASQSISASALVDLENLVGKLKPPVRFSHDTTRNRTVLSFVDQAEKSERTVPGALIFNAKNEVCVLLARLHS